MLTGSPERDLDTQGMQDRKRLAELAGRLALLEIYDEPQARTGRHGELALCHAQRFANLPDGLADLLHGIGHSAFTM